MCDVLIAQCYNMEPEAGVTHFGIGDVLGAFLGGLQRPAACVAATPLQGGSRHTLPCKERLLCIQCMGM
jgi:hypothetical protein